MSEGDRVTLAHGAGGGEMRRLIDEVIRRFLADPELAALDDAAELRPDGTRLAFTTDSFTVKPIFFPGGDIGSLAVSGTVNEKPVTPQVLDEAVTLFYGMMGWDPQTGVPTEGKLHELDIAWAR